MSPRTTTEAAELRTHIAGGIARAIAERLGETFEERFERFQMAIQMIMALSSTDPIETMLAGHCVMSHEMMVATVAEIGTDAPLAPLIDQIVALDLRFHDNLLRLRQRRTEASYREMVKQAQTARERADRINPAPAPAGTRTTARPAGPFPAAAQDATHGVSPRPGRHCAEISRVFGVG
jgi:hypothetical protein